MTKYVVDTNLYVDATRSPHWNQALAGFQRRFAPLLHQHSTVAQEILSGARDRAGYRALYDRWVAPFEQLDRVYTPTHASW